MALVLDVSAIAALVLTDEDAAYANRVLAQVEADGLALAPAIFWLELENLLLMQERRGRIDAPTGDRFLAELAASLPLDTTHATRPGESTPLARRFDLTSYDASYLGLAMGTGSRLATLDSQLIRAAPLAGVELFT